MLVVTTLQVSAQSTVYYTAAKSGLAIRQKPDATSALVDRIPYGTKVILEENNEEWVEARLEGMLGHWRKVKYNNKSGYIVSTYLFPYPPPKETVKDLSGYIAQLSVPFGSKLIVKSPARPDNDMTWELHKQLYKNGAEWHRFIGYEYDSDTYFLPGFTLEQAFLLVRLLPQFRQVFEENAPFPDADRTFKKGDREYKIKVEKENYGGTFDWTERISVEYEDGVIYSFEMYQIDNQIVITFGAGV
jgi:hypothetical protein